MEIPIIEKVKGGYWEIYPDKKLWHNEEDSNKEMKFQDHNKAAEKHGIGGGDWMKLQAGDNKIRIISEMEDYGTHYDKEEKKFTTCLGSENCEICQKRNSMINDGVEQDSKEVTALKPRVQFLFWVIDRADNKVKLLKAGYTIVKQIGEFAKNEEYKFDIVPDYDITIRKVGEKLDTEYTIIPARKSTKLTEKEEALIKEKMTRSPMEIVERMKKKVSAKGGEEDIDVKDIPF